MTNKEFEERLEDILDSVLHSPKDIKQLILDLIGEDEHYETTDEGLKIIDSIRNELRNEKRAIVNGNKEAGV